MIMSDKNLVSSFAWKFLERVGTQVINLVVQIVLARMIAPEEFGSLAVLIVFVNIANIFVQKGLTSSIIRKQKVDELDYNTAFWASMIMALILYLLIFFSAPIIADKYNSIILIKGLRIFSIQLFFGALFCIQNSILVREMRFKTVFNRGIISSLLSGIIGIVMAYLNLGLWALVTQTIVNQFLYCATAWNSITWKPKFQFSMERLRDILGFGGKILLSELLSYMVEGLRTLSIGKVYSTEALSYYDRGQTYPATLMRGIYDALGSVLLPIFSQKQDDNKKLSEAILRGISLTMFLITPIFVGMAAVAKPLIIVLLTDKWIDTVPFFIIFCLYWIPYPIQGICRNGIYAKGNSDVVLKIEGIKTIVTLISLLIALKINVFAIAIAAVITMFIVTIIYVIALKNIISFSYKVMFKGIIKSSISSIIIFFIVSSLSIINVNIFIKLIIQIIVGIISYIICSILLKDKNLSVFLNMIKSKKNK